METEEVIGHRSACCPSVWYSFNQLLLCLSGHQLGPTRGGGGQRSEGNPGYGRQVDLEQLRCDQELKLSKMKRPQQERSCVFNLIRIIQPIDST